jgi:hypothetical protein
MRDECCIDIWSPDAENITHIQTSTGSQYNTSGRNRSIVHENKWQPVTAIANVWVAVSPTRKP